MTGKPNSTSENVAKRVADLRAEAGDMAPRNPSRDALNSDADMLEALAVELSEVEKLREAATFLRDTIRQSIVQTPGPATVETPDGKVHTGPLAEYMHDLLPMIADVLDRALEGDKP